jgi:hypothetical protein
MADEICRLSWRPGSTGRGLQPAKRQQHGGCHHLPVHRNGSPGSLRGRSKGDELRHQKSSPPPLTGSCCGSARSCAMGWASRVWASVGSSSDWCSRRHARRPPKPPPSSRARCAICALSRPAPPADVAAVHPRYTRSRYIGEGNGHQQSRLVPGNRSQPASPAATRQHRRRRARVRVFHPAATSSRSGSVC